MPASAFKSLEDKAAVGAPKPKRIRKRVVDLHWARVIRNIVEIALRIRNLMIDGGRRDLIPQRQHGDTRLQTARTTQQMSGHGFRRTHRQLIGMLAKCALE